MLMIAFHVNRYGDAVEKKWIKWLEEKGKITWRTGTHPPKNRKKKSGYFCSNNKKRYRRDDPIVKVRPSRLGYVRVRSSRP